MDGRDVRAAVRRGANALENRAENLKDNVSGAVYRGAHKVEEYTTAMDHYILAQATRLRNDVAPLLPYISYSGIGFVAGLPVSFYFNSLSIKRVVGVQDYGFPTNVVPVSLLRFIIDLIRATAQSPLLNTYFYVQPRLGLAVRWGLYLGLQPFSYALNTLTVKMLSHKTPVTATEVHQQTLGNEGYGGLFHGIFSQVTREVILKPLILGAAARLMFQTLKWDESVGRIPASVLVHAVTAFLTYPLVFVKRRMQQKTHKGPCTVVQRITAEYEEFINTAKVDISALWTGFGYHFLSLIPSFLLMGAAESVALRFIDHYYTIPPEQQYLWPRILYRVWSLL